MRVLVGIAADFRTQSNCLLTIGMFSVLYWMLSNRDARAAEEFFHKLATGADLSAGDPILMLRNALQDRNGLGERRNTRYAKRRIAALTVKAWNKWRKGKTVKLLKFSDSEAFPEIN